MYITHLVCSPTSKCEEGKGHCSFDEDCKEGLKCGIKNCIKDDSKNCCYRTNGNLILLLGIIWMKSKLYIFLLMHNHFSIVIAQVRQELPEKKKYFFSNREVLNYGTFARFSDHFNVENAEKWKLNTAFWAYPEKYPGTVVSV